jgi:hypothetical protein
MNKSLTEKLNYIHKKRKEKEETEKEKEKEGLIVSSAKELKL